MKSFFVFLALINLTARLSIAAAPTIRLAWSEVEEATSYEVQLSKNKKMLPLLSSYKEDKTELHVELDPGVYYMRVRALSSDGEAGPWSTVEGFTIYDTAPKPLTPEPQKEISLKSPVIFSWEPKEKGTEYLLEVSDKKGVVYQRSTKETEESWSPTQEGEYSWRVGYKQTLGQQWSDTKTFEVEDHSEEQSPSPEPVHGARVEGKVPAAASSSIESPPANISWTDFSVGALWGIYPGGASLQSGLVTWNPRKKILDQGFLRFKLGGSLFPRWLSDGNFMVVDFGLGVSYQPSEICLEMGMGGQVWESFGTYFQAFFEIAWTPPHKILGLANRIFIGLSPIKLPSTWQNQIRFGVGVGI